MAFGELGSAKVIAMNAPKYTSISEPFGLYGTVALYPGMKKPKVHNINIEDELQFNLFLFLQGHTPADKKKLKTFDFVSSPETFEAVVKLKATEGAELYYRFFYLKKFSERQLDKEAPPKYDFTTFGDDISNMLFGLPMYKIGLKKATLFNEEPISFMNKNDKAGGLSVLLPKTPEQIASVEGKLKSMSSQYFYAKKSASNDLLFESAADDSFFTSTFAASSIMMATMEVRTNFEHKSRAKLEIVIPLDELGKL